MYSGERPKRLGSYFNIFCVIIHDFLRKKQVRELGEIEKEIGNLAARKEWTASCSDSKRIRMIAGNE